MDAGQILKQPPSKSMIKQVNELSDALFSLKKSAEAGGLPDMHIEQILVWYRVRVEQEIAKARIDELNILTSKKSTVYLSPTTKGYIKYRLLELSQTLKEHKEV